MTDPRQVIEPLAGHHATGKFSSGVASLNRYLREQAGQDMERRAAAVFVLVGASPNEIAGYHTLSATAVLLSHLPPEVLERLPRYPIVPAILLGRLAVDKGYRGRRYRQLLLLDALYRSWHNSAQIGAVAVIVDAKDAKARSFYERHGFVRFQKTAFRLFLPMSVVGRLFPGQSAGIE